MSLNTPAILTRLETILQGLAAMPTLADGSKPVFIGAPASLPALVNAYITMAGQPIGDKTTNVLRRNGEFWVHFAYRTADDVRAAELAIAALVDQFTVAFFTERRSDMNGVVASCQIDLAPASLPEYRDFSKQEYRVYPIRIIATQQQNV